MSTIFLFNIISTFPFYLTFFCFLGAFGFAFLLYFKSAANKDVAKNVLRLLLVLRLLFISVISFFLLEPMLKYVQIEREKPTLVIAIDNSKSILLNKDSTKIKTEVISNIFKLGEQVSDKFEVKFYKFDSELSAGKEINFNGKETDFSLLYEEIENNYSNRNLGAVLIASDGLYNKGVNPLYSNKNLKYPMYTLALGDTTELKDLFIKKIIHNQVAYLGNKFPADIVVAGKKVKGTKATLTIECEGIKVAQEKFELTDDNFVRTISFTLQANKPGMLRYNAYVTYADGETNKLNNSSSFVVEVIDSREKILILANAPHPDVAAIKQAIEVNKNYEVKFALASDFNTSLKQFSLVVVHMLPWNNSSRIKNELEASNIPYFLISANGNDVLPELQIAGVSDNTNDVEPIVNKNFSLFNISPELKLNLKSFPALKSPLGNYTSSNDLNPLLSQRIGTIETQNPLFYFTFNSQQKAAVFLGDGIWRWRLRDYADHGNFILFNELINKTVQYLSVKEDKSFFRIYTKKLFNENEEIEMDAEVYNNSYELINSTEVTLNIKNDKGKNYDYTFSKSNNGYKLGGISFPPGEYSYQAKTNVNNNLYYKKGFFTVREVVSEQINTVADHQLLYNLSVQSAAKMYYPNQLQELTKELLLKEEIKTISFEQKQLTDLIELKWIFFVLLAFVTTEWFIRKRSGLY